MDRRDYVLSAQEAEGLVGVDSRDEDAVEGLASLTSSF